MTNLKNKHQTSAHYSYISIRFRKLITSIILIASAQFSFANFDCDGEIKYIGIAADNGFLLDYGYGIHKLCTLDKEHCKAWSALAMSLHAQGKRIRVYHENADLSITGVTACQGIGSWVDVPAYFVAAYY